MKTCINNNYNNCTPSCKICKGDLTISYLTDLKLQLFSKFTILFEIGKRCPYSNKIITPQYAYILIKNKVEEYIKINKLPKDYFSFYDDYLHSSYSVDKVLKSFKQTNYVKDERVLVKVKNIKTNELEWRDGIVLESKEAYSRSSSYPYTRYSYPIIKIELLCTYCKKDESKLIFYSKIDTNLFINLNLIKSFYS